MDEDTGQQQEILELTVSPGEGGRRLDAFLASRLGGLPRAVAADIVRSRLLDGPWKPGGKVRPGQLIRLRLRVKERREPDFPLRVVHEDSFLIVVDKPAGQLVHPPRRGITNTLVDLLSARYGSGVNLVHRLDRETSGLLVAARDSDCARQLSRLFQAHRVEKTYLAVVSGVPDPPEGTIDAPLGKDRSSPVRDRQKIDPEHGRPAQTVYRTLRSTPERSLVEARPRSGRLHQIRVHLASLGTPLLGDKLYGPDENLFLRFIEEGFSLELREKLVLPRHALHAAGLAFTHPASGDVLTCTAPLPDDMATLFE